MEQTFTNLEILQITVSIFLGLGLLYVFGLMLEWFIEDFLL